MKIPNAENAVVDLAKLREYCLDPAHPRGKHKARAFAAVLGLTGDDAESLRDALLDAVRTSERAVRGEKDGFGQRYVLDFDYDGPSSSAVVRSAWIVRSDEDFPRFVSCFVR